MAHSGQFAFISYSTKDSNFVEELASELKKEGVWVDKWNMDLGDPLPAKIEGGIAQASEFILILSKASLASRWVQYECHMAVIRALEDSNFRIVVVRIDTCDLPLRFKPFLYVDTPKAPRDAIPRLQEFLKGRRLGQGPGTILFRRHFVNRADDIGRIERHLNDPETSVICLQGFFGIGKRTLAEEAIRRIWQSPDIALIQLTGAHTGARLCLDLCATAGVKLPEDGATQAELERLSLLAVETIISRRRILVFDQLESILDEDGMLPPDMRNVLGHLAEMPACLKMPVFLLSRRFPNLDPIPKTRIGFLRLRGMQTEHIVTILENEANRVVQEQYADREALLRVAEQLYGYPLGARLAAPLLVRYTPEFLLQNLSHITALRVDIAEAILAHTVLNPEEVRNLELLALSGTALSVDDLTSITGQSAESVVKSLDNLTTDSLLELEGAAVRLHPLVADFYWKQARSSPNFKSIAKDIANHAQESIKGSKAGTREFVSWLALACRMMYLSGDFAGAQKLRHDLIGELKVACIDLYQHQEYELSLQYCDAYLQSDSDDFQVRFHKARCLSRLERSDEALTLIDELTQTSASTPNRRARLHFARARVYLEKRESITPQELEEAKLNLLKSIQSSPDYVPALQGIAEILIRLHKIDDADGFLKRALRISPMDSFALSLQADVLWRQGHHEDAIQKMELVTKTQPQNANFLFRLGRFLQQTGKSHRAYDLFKKAKESDSSYWDASLSLASVAIDLGLLEEAQTEIGILRGKVTGDKRRVLDSIEADYELARGNLHKARELIRQSLQRERNVVSLGIMAKLEIAECRKATSGGMKVLAESHRVEALKLVKEGLQIDTSNPQLLKQKETIANL